MDRLQIALPDPVACALSRLEACGYEAYAVGGCVRDSLLAREPNDWDVTTSARPEETARCFSDCRTIETGIKHGTLTVLLDGMSIEITTFRNDGVYEDNRHPVQVTFSERVEDDLSRRDFTVNAMAYHPRRGLVDLFGGELDLARRRIACVGDPKLRFCEDGLRILRAVRFASVLDFGLDPATASAVHDCKGLLSNIAPERIREEFCKLLMGAGAVRMLREYHDVIAVFLPELERCVGFSQNSRYHCYDVYEHTLHALEEAPRDLITRLAILLHDVGKPLCYTEDEAGGHFKGHAPVGTELTRELLRRLRFDNATAEEVTMLVEAHDRPVSAEKKAVKRLMRQMSDATILRLMEVKRCDRLAHAPEHCTPDAALLEIPCVMAQIRAADECLSLRDLKIDGEDLLSLGIPRGREIGRILGLLLDAVVDGVLPNDTDALLCEAKKQMDEKKFS